VSDFNNPLNQAHNNETNYFSSPNKESSITDSFIGKAKNDESIYFRNNPIDLSSYSKHYDYQQDSILTKQLSGLLSGQNTPSVNTNNNIHTVILESELPGSDNGAGGSEITVLAPRLPSTDLYIPTPIMTGTHIVNGGIFHVIVYDMKKLTLSNNTTEEQLKKQVIQDAKNSGYPDASTLNLTDLPWIDQAVRNISNSSTNKNIQNQINNEITSVTQDYKNMLNRSPDPDGFNDYMQAAISGVSTATIAHEIAYSPEATSKLQQNLQDVMARPYQSSDAPWLSGTQSAIAQGNYTLTQTRHDLAYYPEATARLKQDLQDVMGRPYQNSDAPWLNGTQSAIAQGNYTAAQLRWDLAHYPEATARLKQDLQDVMGRPYQDSDAPWLSDTESAIGQANNSYTAAQARWDLAHYPEATAHLKQDLQDVMGRPYQDSDAPWLSDTESAIGQANNSYTAAQARWDLAHYPEATTRLKQMFQITMGRAYQNGDAAWLSNTESAIGQASGSYTFIQATSAAASSPEAMGNVDSFLQNAVGQVTGDLQQAGASMLSKLAQTYEAIQSDSSDALQSLAAGYKATFGQGNIIRSLMPNTTQGWLGLAANVALIATPPGDAVVAGELLSLGTEDLLASALDNETNAAIGALATTGASDLLPTIVSQPDLDIVSQFVARQSGATLDLGNGVVVTQTEGDLNKAGALIFKGGNFSAVENYFKRITGYSGDIEAIDSNSANLPAGAKVYRVKTNSGTFSLRNITSSTGDWTIVFGNKLSNGIRELKFEFTGN